MENLEMNNTLLRRALFSLLIASACADELPAPEPPQPEAFRELCAPYFACECEAHQYPDLETCMTYHHAMFAELHGKAEALGLHTDLECYLELTRVPEDRCLTPSEDRLLHPYEPSLGEPTSCGECQPMYGERQVGEPCLPFGHMEGSDCAQGLLCEGTPGVCIDPCAPTPVGQSCAGPAFCGPGRFCSYPDEICQERAGLGESCFRNDCVEGLVCERFGHYCIVPAGVDEQCNSTECQPELECVPNGGGWICRPISGRGELCESRCDEDSWCDEWDYICRRWRELDEPCEGNEGCAAGLACVFGTCRPPPGPGEPCDYTCELRHKCEDGICVAEEPLICG